MFMYCTKCGKEIAKGNSFCTHCGNRVSNVNNVNNPVNFTQRGVVRNISNTNTNFNNKKRKKNKIIKISCCAASVAVVAIVVLANFSNVLGFFAKSFAPPETYAKYVCGKALLESGETLLAAYDNVFTPIADGKSYETKTTISIDDALSSRLYSYTGVDFSSIKNISIVNEPIESDNVIGNNMKLSVNDKQVLSPSIMIDSSKLYLNIPELNSTSIAEELPNTYISNYRKLFESIPDSKKVSNILSDYGKIALDNAFSDVEKNKTKYTVNGIEGEATELKINFTSSDALNISENILKKAINDEELLNTVVDFADAYYNGLGIGSYMSKEEMKTELRDELNATLKDVQDSKNSNSMSDDSIVVKLLVDNKHNILGIELTDQYNETIFSSQKAVDGNEFGYSLNFEDFMIKGSGTDKNNKLNGQYEVVYDGVTLYLIDFNDFAIDNEGILSGKMSVKPSRQCLEEMVSYSLSDTLSLLDMSLQMEFNGNNNLSFAVNLMSGDTAFLRLSNEANLIKPEAANVPTNSVSIDDWVNNINTSYIVSTIRDLGFDESLIQSIEDEIY